MSRYAIALTVLLSREAAAQAPRGSEPFPELRVVLLHPADLAPPPGAEERIAQAAEYSEKFLVQWMKFWNYPPAREQIFPRDEQGRIVVRTIQSKHPASFFTNNHADALQEARAIAHEKFSLPKNGSLWWLWVYNGDPPARFRGFQGGGGLKDGGWSVVNYDSQPGELLLDREMAAGFNEAFSLKGCVHELGHAFGLPHVGPRPGDDLGITLMGPRTDVYRQRTKSQEERIYLSEAEAAMLWKHFLFSGSTENRHLMPRIEVQDLTLRNDAAKKAIVVTGRLVSNGTAHSVLVFDSAAPDQLDYWQKVYVARVQERGAFEVTITEPTRQAGELRIAFCFNNGAITGDGKTEFVRNAYLRKYSYTGRSYSLAP